MTRASSIVLVAATVGLTACSPGEPDEQAVITAFFHSGQGAERDTFDAQVLDYNASHDAQVQIEVVPEGDYDDAVVAAADEGRLPCLLDLDGPYLQPYVSAGYLLPLDDLIDDDLRADLLPSIVEQGTANDGLQYGVGVFDSGLALWGNRDHLDRAGVRIPTGIDDAWDLAEFDAALDAL